MKSRTELYFYTMLVIGIALLAGIAVYATDNIPFVFQTENDIVPRTISALPRVRKINGQKAIKNIRQLCGDDFNLEDGTFAIYGNKNVVLWVSNTGSEQGAEDLIDSMRSSFVEGSGFQELGSFELFDNTINELEGFEQMHYYWQTDKLVVWLTVDATFADGALGETVLYYR